MASKWQTCRLSETQDRRVKLTKAKKEEIARKFETGEYSLRGLAREYNVSHKTISLIVDQRAKRKTTNTTEHTGCIIARMQKQCGKRIEGQKNIKNDYMKKES